MLDAFARVFAAIPTWLLFAAAYVGLVMVVLGAGGILAARRRARPAGPGVLEQAARPTCRSRSRSTHPEYDERVDAELAAHDGDFAAWQLELSAGATFRGRADRRRMERQ